MKILVEDLGRSFTVLNIYGPTHDRPQLWNELLAKLFLKDPSLILGGDLNFSTGAAESWGQKSQINSLSIFFAHKLEGAGLIDVNPIRLGPTWRNKRMGEDYIAKRLDHFLISSSLVEEPLLFRQWTGTRGESYHFLIFLELAGATKKLAIPFKFNSTWLKEESFQKLVQEVWVPLVPIERATLQFVRNLKELKIATKAWEKQRKQQLDADLVETEADLQTLYDSAKGGFASPEQKDSLLSL